MATEESSAVQKPEEAVTELPAPPGWKKTYKPGKSGTPKRNQIVFTSPSGEEIKTKNQLDKYLKSHPGGPAASEFDWSTGETPRRSSRISSKAKATESLEDEPPSKRSRSKKAAKTEADKTDDEDKDAEEKEISEAAKEIKSSEDAEMQDVENVKQVEKGDISSGELMEGIVPTSVENVEGITPMKEQESTLAGSGLMSEEKVEVNTEVVEQHGDAFKESIPAGDGSMSEKVEVSTEVREQHGDAFKEPNLEDEQKSTLAGDVPMAGETLKTQILEQHGDAFKEPTLEKERKSTLAGDAPMTGETLKTEIPEQHGDAFEDFSLAKEQISVSSLKVPETNESKGADINPKGPEIFQEFETFSEANIEGTVNETMQIAGGSVEGARDCLAESKAPVQEDVVDMEKSSHKGGEVETTPSAEEANFQEAETFSEANIGGTVNETMQIVGGSVEGARDGLAESKAPVPEDVVDMEKSSHKGGEVETNPSAEEANFQEAETFSEANIGGTVNETMQIVGASVEGASDCLAESKAPVPEDVVDMEKSSHKGGEVETNPYAEDANFQEAETFSEVNIGGTIDETMQIAGGSVEGARDCLAESKAPVPEDVVDMEKSSHKGGEVETNPYAEVANFQEAETFSELNIGGTIDETMQIVGGSVEGARDCLAESKAPVPEDVVDMEKSSHKGGEVETTPSAEEANFQEAETFSEANIGGTVNETMQIAGGSVEGARDCLAESKAPVPEDGVDMEKSSHKGGEVETNPSAEEANFQEAETFSEANIGGAINETMQIARGSVEGARDCLAESKAAVPEDAVDMEKFSHKGGEVETNPYAEEANFQEAETFSEVNIGGTINETMQIAGGSVEGARDCPSESKAPVPEDVVDMEKSSHKGGEVETIPSAEEASLRNQTM